MDVGDGAFEVRPARRNLGLEVMAWVAATLYPVALLVAVRSWPPADDRTSLLLLGLLTVLPIGLLWLRPIPALGLILVGSFAAITVEPDWRLGALLAVVQTLAVGVVAYRCGRWVSAAAAVVTIAVQIGSATFYTGSQDFVGTVAFQALAIVVAWLIGQSIRQRQDQAQAQRAHAAAEAITAERLRIARELHDMIAHSIGVIAIQAGVGRRVIDTQPTEARNALSIIESTSRDTLSGLRRVLGALRQADPDAAMLAEPVLNLADLDRLVAATQDGVRVELEWRGRPRALPADIEMSGYRIIQEAVTNVVRHAGAGECRIVVDYREAELAVEVVDDGPGRASTATGYGIAGMRERAGLLGGRFSAGPRREGGFRVAAWLPIPGGDR